MKAFAVDYYIDSMDYRAYLERLGAWSCEQEVPLLPEDDLSRQLDKAAMREEITSDIRTFCLSIGLDTEWRSVREIKDTEAFLKTIALKDLSFLKVERLFYAEPDTQDSENIRKV